MPENDVFYGKLLFFFSQKECRFPHYCVYVTISYVCTTMSFRVLIIPGVLYIKVLMLIGNG